LEPQGYVLGLTLGVKHRKFKHTFRSKFKNKIKLSDIYYICISSKHTKN